MLELALPHVSTGMPGPAGGATIRPASPTLIAEVDAVAAAANVAPGQLQAHHRRVHPPAGESKPWTTRTTRRPLISPGATRRSAQFLRDVAATGIDHIQVVLDPITVPGVERLCHIVETLR